jgi:hypothetical protein
VNERSGVAKSNESKLQNSGVASVWEQDAIYQNGKLVARVLEPEVDWDAKEVRFGEISESDHLLIPEECEFQNYRIILQRIIFASKVDKHSDRKGRVLRGCVADILGYRGA